MSKDAKNVPALRFKGYSDAWEKRKLGDVVERVTRKNRDLVSTRPLTISAQDVLVDQRNFFSKTVASKNISNYFLLKAGDFAYNKSYSVGYPWGAVKRLDKYPSGVLSTLYIVFKPKKINSQFLVTYFEGTTWYVSVSKVASEGARNHGLLNISASDFFDQQLFFPTKKTEQESIGLTIKVLDDLIAATQHKIDALEQVKETLSKNLFDQLWRFKEYSTSWKENKLKDIVSAYSGGTPSANIRTYYGGHIPFIRSAEIHSSTTALTLTQEGLKNSSAKLVKTGDILYALYGANSGDVDRSKINGAINQAILAMRPSKENDSNFILFQLMRMKNKIVSTYLQGGQGNLSGRIILALNLDMPESTSEQRTIGRSLQLLCELISINQSKYSQLESLKKSLLQNLFV
ncbi:MAG: restriction endonuclease subunit S [Lacticaseibacillus paracasei]